MFPSVVCLMLVDSELKGESGYNVLTVCGIVCAISCNVATIVLQMYVSVKSQSHIEIKDYSGTSLYGYTHMQDCPPPLIDSTTGHYTVEVYEFNVSYHTHMRALYGKEDDKLGGLARQLTYCVTEKIHKETCALAAERYTSR